MVGNNRQAKNVDNGEKLWVLRGLCRPIFNVAQIW